MFGGGFECGINVLFIGVVGVGKFLVVLSYVIVVVECGEYVVFFVFDEGCGMIEV